jgi:hypothetical protein
MRARPEDRTMTTNKVSPQIHFRKLWVADTEALKAHLLRLDPESRRMRFGTPVSDFFIKQYAENALGSHSIAHGYFVDGVLRGVAELRGFRGITGGDAEAAFSVESGRNCSDGRFWSRETGEFRSCSSISFRKTSACRRLQRNSTPF